MEYAELKPLLEETLGKIKNPLYVEFFKSLTSQTLYGPARFPEYFTSPGSSISKDGQRRHHAYKGGLAYHSITAANLGYDICRHYKGLGIEVDSDLVVLGILIHDIGKAGAYQIKDDGTILKTDREKLHHHIPWGYKEVDKEFDDFGSRFPESDKNKILHIILSHHGRKSWSSPVIPQFLEAYIVHMVEFMDGMVEKYNEGRIPDSLYDSQ